MRRFHISTALLSRIALISVVTALGILAWYAMLTSSRSNLPTVRIDGALVYVEVADSDDEKLRGLSGRESLQEDHGMLFVHEKEDYYGYWMPDMRFSLDIFWIDRAFDIVHIEEEVSPESYPKVFKPLVPAQYVLEVPAGFSKKHGITVGDTLTFE